jgi:hypothetical protein
VRFHAGSDGFGLEFGVFRSESYLEPNTVIEA